VMREGNRTRLWYTTWKNFGTPWPNASANMRVLYAESSDGHRWSKPPLRQQADDPDSNVIAGLSETWNEGVSVWRDPHASLGEHYVTQAKLKSHGGQNDSLLVVSISPDGVRDWRVQSTWRIGSMDTQEVAFFDPIADQYMLYARDWSNIEGSWPGCPACPAGRYPCLDPTLCGARFCCPTARGPASYRAVRRFTGPDANWSSRCPYQQADPRFARDQNCTGVRVLAPDAADRVVHHNPLLSAYNITPVDYDGASICLWPPAQGAGSAGRVYIMMTKRSWHWDLSTVGQLGSNPDGFNSSFFAK